MLEQCLLRQDLDMITKDTLSLDDLPDDAGETSAWAITEVSEGDMTADLDSIISKLDSLGPASPRTLSFSSPRSQSTTRVFPLIPQRFSSLSSGEFSWPELYESVARVLKKRGRLDTAELDILTLKEAAAELGAETESNVEAGFASK